MNTDEMRETGGAWFWPALGAISALYSLGDGFIDGYNEATQPYTN